MITLSRALRKAARDARRMRLDQRRVTSEEARDQYERVQRESASPRNRIRQHRPAFFEGFENLTVAFDTTEELLAIPFVQNFHTATNFHQFSLSGDCLLAEYRGGREWWVAGVILHPELVELPKWDGGIYETAEGEFPAKEVKWSDATQVCLRDGRLVKKSAHAGVRPSI